MPDEGEEAPAGVQIRLYLLSQLQFGVLQNLRLLFLLLAFAQTLREDLVVDVFARVPLLKKVHLQNVLGGASLFYG